MAALLVAAAERGRPPGDAGGSNDDPNLITLRAAHHIRAELRVTS